MFAAGAAEAADPKTAPAKPKTAAETAAQAQEADEKASQAIEGVADVARKAQTNEAAIAEVKEAVARRAEAEKRESERTSLAAAVDRTREHAKDAEIAAASGRLKDADTSAGLADVEAKKAQKIVAAIAARMDGGKDAAEAQVKADAATSTAKSARDKVDAKRAAVCGRGETWIPCFYAGAFVSSASVATLYADGSHGGKTSHALVAAVIPTVGMRLPLDQQQRFSLDIGALSMLASKDISTEATTHKGCRKGDGNFEDKLPCEGNAALIPWVGVYVGLTVSASDIGLLTFMPMAGAASTSLDRNVYPFVGLSIGLISLTKTIQ